MKFDSITFKLISFMKQSKIHLALIIFIFLALTKTTAQVDVKISPLNLLLGNIAGAVEVGVTPNVGIEATLGHSWTKLTIESNEYKSSKPRYGINVRYYVNPNEKGLNNFYGALYTRGSNAHLTRTSDNVTGTYNRVGLGFMVGYKLVTRNEKLIFDFNLGFGRTLRNQISLSDSKPVNLNNIPFVNWDIPATISIGYRF